MNLFELLLKPLPHARQSRWLLPWLEVVLTPAFPLLLAVIVNSFLTSISNFLFLTPVFLPHQFKLCSVFSNLLLPFHIG